MKIVAPLLLTGVICISASTLVREAASADVQPQYEAWIVSLNPERGTRCLPIHPRSIFERRFECGHAFIATVKNAGSGWQVANTFAFWNANDSKEGPLKVKYDEDMKATEKIINGQSPSWTGYAVRKARISPERFEWLNKEAFRTQCFAYPTSPSDPAKSIYYCYCTQYATRLWSTITSRWEKYTSIFPEDLTAEIQATTKSQGTDFLDGGKEWK